MSLNLSKFAKLSGLIRMLSSKNCKAGWAYEYATGHRACSGRSERDWLGRIRRSGSDEAGIAGSGGQLGHIVSKLSPLVGNLIEFNSCEYLNDQEGFAEFGKWQRQDPGFPDTIFMGTVTPIPGFEIKAWFPLATEITARFKDSQNHFTQDQTYVATLAWLPEFLIFGKPRMIDIVVVSGASVAKAREGLSRYFR